MFNIAVVKLEDIIRYIAIIIATIVGITILNNSFQGENRKDRSEKNNYEKIRQIGSNFSKYLSEVLPKANNKEIGHANDKIETKTSKKENLKIAAIETEISSMKYINKLSNNEAENKTEEKPIEPEKSNTETEQTPKEEQKNENENGNSETKIITKNPLKDNANLNYGKVKIKNQTEYNLTQEDLTPNIKIENKKILIFHTHTCESYTQSEANKYTPSGNFRSTDLKYSVARVGDELTNNMAKKGYDVLHDKTYHDYPAYNGSYTRSLKTVEAINKNDKRDIIFDIHRDAIGSRSDYAPTVKIGNDEAAQIMFVIGTNQGGLWHPNWKDNLKFAIKVQEKGEEMYPGLFKTMMITKSRYNQHTGKYASIIEIGATGNTLEQSINSMKYLSNVLAEILK